MGNSSLLIQQIIAPSMFGRDLVEQVHADAQVSGSAREIPVIVEKCIEAVEAIGTRGTL